MDWIKVKTRHIGYDFDSIDPKISWAWVQLMGMTAALERIPSEEQMRHKVTNEAYDGLVTILERNNTTLEKVLEKVMEDVRAYVRDKEHIREYMRSYRRKGLRKGLREPHVSGKNRIEKNRIDKKKQRRVINDPNKYHSAKNNNSNKDKSERPTNRGTKVSESGEVQSFVAGVAKGMEAGV